MNKDGQDKGSTMDSTFKEAAKDSGGKEIAGTGSSNPNPEDSGDASARKRPGPASVHTGNGGEPQGDGKKKTGGSGGDGDWGREGPATMKTGNSAGGSKPGSGKGDGGDWSGEGPKGFKPGHTEGSEKRVGGVDPADPVTCPSCASGVASQLEQKSSGALATRGVEAREMAIGAPSSIQKSVPIGDFGGFGRSASASQMIETPTVTNRMGGTLEHGQGRTLRQAPATTQNSATTLPSTGNLNHSTQQLIVR